MLPQRSDINQSFLSAGIIALPELLDNQFQSIEDSEVYDLWQKWVYQLPKNLTDTSGPLPKPLYILPIFDCNKQAASFAAFVIQDNAVKRGANCVAFGNLSYWVGGDATKGHTVCWYIRGDGSLAIFEEQNATILTLSTAELNSVFGAFAA